MAEDPVSTIMFCNVNANRSDWKHVTLTALRTQQVSLTDAEIERGPPSGTLIRRELDQGTR